MIFASGERHWVEREFILLFVSFPHVLLGFLFIFTLNIFTLLIKKITTWADMKQGSMTGDNRDVDPCCGSLEGVVSYSRGGGDGGFCRMRRSALDGDKQRLFQEGPLE